MQQFASKSRVPLARMESWFQGKLDPRVTSQVSNRIKYIDFWGVSNSCGAVALPRNPLRNSIHVELDIRIQCLELNLRHFTIEFDSTFERKIQFEFYN